MSITESPTVGLLSMALDATALRHRAIAENIANAQTAGYQRRGVSFAAHVTAGSPVATARPVSAPTLVTVGGAVALDQELAALSENTLQQQALLKALNRHLGMLHIAVNEGRR